MPPPTASRDRERSTIIPGEPPLLVFVSSVMRPDLKRARDETYRTFGGTPFAVPWLFEYTPASSVGAEDTYLQIVRDGDIVVWLAGKVRTDRRHR